MSVIASRCPNCGADIQFNPELQTCKCEFCLSSFTVEELETRLNQHSSLHQPEEIIEESLDPQQWKEIQENTVLYNCPNCGAEIIADKTTAATFCYYCHNPIVLSDQIAGEFKPSKIIPFQFNRERAIESLKKWCKTKWFLPSDFTSEKQLEKLTGIYLPFWLADYELTGQLSARAQKVTTWSRGDYLYTKTDEYAVFRQADMNFEHVPQNGSTKAEDTIMESIEPFHYKDLKDFSLSYLSGFMAERYDRSKEDVSHMIQNRVKDSVQSVLRSSIHHYSSITIRGVHTQFHKNHYHYTLLPVWIMTYHYNGNTYLFAMNGQTGKVFGALPLSRKKLGMLFTGISVCTFILCFLGGLLL